MGDLGGIRGLAGSDWERAGMTSFPCLVRSVSPSGDSRYALGDPLVDPSRSYRSGGVALSNERSPLEDAPLQTVHEFVVLVWVQVAVPVEHHRHGGLACHGRHLLRVRTISDPEGDGGMP